MGILNRISRKQTRQQRNAVLRSHLVEVWDSVDRADEETFLGRHERDRQNAHSQDQGHLKREAFSDRSDQIRPTPCSIKMHHDGKEVHNSPHPTVH